MIGIDGLFQVVIAFVLTIFIFGVLINMALLPFPKSWQKAVNKAGKNAIVAIWTGAWRLVFWILTAPFIGIWRAIRRMRNQPPPPRPQGNQRR